MAEAGDAIGGGAQAIISSAHARACQTAGLLDAESAGRSPRNALRRRPPRDPRGKYVLCSDVEQPGPAPAMVAMMTTAIAQHPRDTHSAP